MFDVELEKIIVKIGISMVFDVYFKVEGEVFKFDGFLKVYLEFIDDEDEDQEVKGMLFLLKVGQDFNLFNMIVIQWFICLLFWYMEVVLVKKLEELGIGCLFIYVFIISKIMELECGYIIKEMCDGIECDY